MTTIQVAIFRVARAENYWRVTASVMGFPLASPAIGTAVSVGKLFPAALTVATGLIKGPLNLVWTELILTHADISTSFFVRLPCLFMNSPKLNRKPNAPKSLNHRNPKGLAFA